jgi:hypothetical protein
MERIIAFSRRQLTSPALNQTDNDHLIYLTGKVHYWYETAPDAMTFHLHVTGIAFAGLKG